MELERRTKEMTTLTVANLDKPLLDRMASLLKRYCVPAEATQCIPDTAAALPEG